MPLGAIVEYIKNIQILSPCVCENHISTDVVFVYTQYNQKLYGYF